ncbi:hypothetical protein [Rhizobium gallicum]|uniref:hypothetical protein n=1 Tax=Rhizobium gallicum TaxID=56730 RepID=UPI001EF7A20E|nr:hypothetical protein [Rhizobium gallicum]ULJ76522.1 hypothetical protein L2W42_29585 [Rhizobium gallicum]
MALKRVRFITGLMAFYSPTLPVTAEVKQRSVYDDKPMICAALYRGAAQGYEDVNDTVNADRYMKKFQILYEQGIANVIAAGGTQEEAHKATQRFADIVGEMAIKKNRALGSLIAMCRREFP